MRELRTTFVKFGNTVELTSYPRHRYHKKTLPAAVKKLDYPEHDTVQLTRKSDGIRWHVIRMYAVQYLITEKSSLWSNLPTKEMNYHANTRRSSKMHRL
jgi:hypothetical protein